AALPLPPLPLPLHMPPPGDRRDDIPKTEMLPHRGTDGRDSLSDGRHETRDGRHACRVVNTAWAAEESWTARRGC
nr:hypothetical protein [Tanacetum cinerariifolium]